jgi:arylsulfatase
VASRVPLIARWPGRLAAGGRCGAPASLQDIWRTVLRAGGANDAGPTEEESVDLAELAEGGSKRQVVYSQFQRRGYGLYLAASATQKYVYSAPDAREWFFDAGLDPRESRDLSADPFRAEAMRRLREETIARFQRDGYTGPLNGDAWRSWPRREVPPGDSGLLFQDDAGLQERIDALGPYARKVTVPPGEASTLLKTKE